MKALSVAGVVLIAGGVIPALIGALSYCYPDNEPWSVGQLTCSDAFLLQAFGWLIALAGVFLLILSVIRSRSKGVSAH